MLPITRGIFRDLPEGLRRLAAATAELEAVHADGSLFEGYHPRMEAVHRHNAARLREIAEVIAAKQEIALVFTQFREATEPLAAFLRQGRSVRREMLVQRIAPGGTRRRIAERGR